MPRENALLKPNTQWGGWGGVGDQDGQNESEGVYRPFNECESNLILGVWEVRGATHLTQVAASLIRQFKG